MNRTTLLSLCVVLAVVAAFVEAAPREKRQLFGGVLGFEGGQHGFNQGFGGFNQGFGGFNGGRFVGGRFGGRRFRGERFGGFGSGEEFRG